MDIPIAFSFHKIAVRKGGNTLELWNFAKQIAQSEGRKDDWVYIVDTYKATGGKEMTMFLIGKGGRFEVLGETNQKKVILVDKHGELSVIEKSEVKTFKKKFEKRSNYEKEIKKSTVIDGEKITVNVLVGGEFK